MEIPIKASIKDSNPEEFKLKEINIILIKNLLFRLFKISTRSPIKFYVYNSAPRKLLLRFFFFSYTDSSYYF